ncbi:MAG: serine protein kinase RIO [Candidatus Nanoarchaeia archaeon]|jgi:RIO kinase 1
MVTREKFKVFEGVFDNNTLNALQKLCPKYFSRLSSPISTGKEADVYLAEKSDGYVALKIYRILARMYKGLDVYIRDDPRFKSVGRNPREVIYNWTKKEFKNLSRAASIGVRVPEPITFNKNVLVMEFIGHGDKASPLARNALPSNPRKWFKLISGWVMNMWDDKQMVHGDLSEWNIINHDDKPVIIDISQAVLKQHPLSLKLLKRDVYNINNWFSKQGVKVDSLNNWLDEVIKNV